MTEMKDTVTILALVIGLPPSIWAIYQLVRLLEVKFSKKIRGNRNGLVGLEKERAYLFAFQAYLEELDRPLGYMEDEYTPLAGSLVDKEAVSLRFFFRRASSEDQIGLKPQDIIPTAEGKYIRNIFEFLMKSKRPTVILGEPGSGKSVTLRHAALEITRRQIAKNPMWPIVPLYLQLGAFDQTDDLGHPLPILDFIKRQLREVIPGGSNIVEPLDDILRQRRAVILLDSMDEMPTADFYSRAQKLKEFLIEFGSSNVVSVACRRREYSGELPHSELIIEPFDTRRIKEYLERNWKLYSRYFLRPEQRHMSYDNYMGVSNADHPLFPFASNPFFLKLLTRFFFLKGGNLPESQADIFQSYIDEKIEHESKRHNILIDDQEQLLSIWAGLAYGMIKANFGTYVHLSRSIGNIVTLQLYTNEEVNDAISIAISCGLIRKESDGSVRFEHHRILEYLAAWYWEKNRAIEKVASTHLRNPWWRETLVLRAGITNDPNEFIEEIVKTIEPEYLKTLGEGDGRHEFSIELKRLEYVVTFEVIMLCARQRWKELETQTRLTISSLLEGIAKNGTVLEKVRLIRSMAGLPIKFYYDSFKVMVRSKSDWLVSELFNSIDHKDYRTIEFAEVLEAFLQSIRREDIFQRFRLIHGLSLLKCIRTQPKLMRTVLPQAIVASVLSWVLVVVLMVPIYWLLFGFAFNPMNPNTTTFIFAIFWKQIAAVSTLSFLLFLISGWKLTIVAAGLYGLFLLIFPPVTSFKYFFVVFAFFLLIGDDFRRAKWIRKSVVRAIVLFGNIHRVWRIIVLYGFWNATIVLVNLYLTGEHFCPIQISLPSSILLALLSEYILYSFCARRIKKLLKGADTVIDSKSVETLLDKYISELRKPWPKELSKNILDRIVELPLEEGKLISRLKRLADSGEFFLKPDDILEAVDRIDLRRRQKALQS